MKFLETVGQIGYKVLININRIECIIILHSHEWSIIIVSDNEQFREVFGEDKNKLEIRYQQIKEIVQGA